MWAIQKHSEITKRNQRKIAEILDVSYKGVDHNNKKNPLDELIYILFSVTKTEAIYTKTYQSFKKAFPRYEDVKSASIEQIAKVIYHGGQSIQKATAIKSIIKILSKKFGRPTLAPIKKMSDSDCEAFLLSLPRVGKKVARCVMLYALDRKVFPVDTHCRRVSIRLGWIEQNKFDEDLLQKIIPKNLRLSLHVNFISLGREFCRARLPLCLNCPLTNLCPKIGVESVDFSNTPTPPPSRAYRVCNTA